MNRLFLFLILFAQISSHAFAQEPSVNDERPLALIYKGPGSCSKDQGDAGESGYGCSEAAADAAHAAGFQVRYVGPNALSDIATPIQVHRLFGNAKVWIQPGGISNRAFYAMTLKLRHEIVAFVADGGGYVGFCAGAYLATDWFNILPATSVGYRYTPERSDVEYAFLRFIWNGKPRMIYFEGGPYLTNVDPSVEIAATFADGDYAAAARTTYHKGRVYISAAHPEAPAIWSEEDHLHDPDGSDRELAAQMIGWAAGL
jgi:glutamine amidotransferase-like uncharacterized protein